MRFPNDKWSEIICQYKASVLSDLEWCRRNNIPSRTFYYQLQKYRDPECTQADIIPSNVPEHQQAQCPEHHEIVPLIIRYDDDIPVTDAGHSIAAKLMVKGISIELYGDTGSDVIRSIISVIGSLFGVIRSAQFSV